VSFFDFHTSKNKFKLHLPRSRRSVALLLAVVFIVVSFLFLKIVARKGFLNTLSQRESLGIYPTPMGQYFDIKWYGLENYVTQNGGVDVILIGSSAVNSGFDPNIVAATYFNLTGKRLRIYNFGIEGLDIVPNSIYAQILVQKYHPALVLFGMLPRDYLGSDNADVNQQFLSSPWIKFQSGEWDLAGFLIDRSPLLRHYLPYRNWMRSDFLNALIANNHRTNRTSSSGYEPDNYTGTNLDQHPNPSDPAEKETFAKYSDFKIDPARLDCLQTILNLQKAGTTRVIVMEMPLQPTFYDYLGGISVYQEYQNEIASFVTASGVLFFPSNGDPQIPGNGRSDRTHLNKFGAPVMSTYLGTQLAALTNKDGIQFTTSGQGGR
jgi:hypothetical protein